jgi:hypothetical protein
MPCANVFCNEPTELHSSSGYSLLGLCVLLDPYELKLNSPSSFWYRPSEANYIDICSVVAEMEHADRYMDG